MIDKAGINKEIMDKFMALAREINRTLSGPICVMLVIDPRDVVDSVPPDPSETGRTERGVLMWIEDDAVPVSLAKLRRMVGGIRIYVEEIAERESRKEGLDP